MDEEIEALKNKWYGIIGMGVKTVQWDFII